MDEALKEIGGFGAYHRKLYFLLCIPILFVGAANFSYVFVAATPRYRYECCIVIYFFIFLSTLSYQTFYSIISLIISSLYSVDFIVSSAILSI